MNGALWPLLDGQSSDFKSASRFASFNQQSPLRTRRAYADSLKTPLVKRLYKSKTRRRFLLKSSLDDTNSPSAETLSNFREELVQFAKTAPTSPDQDSFYGQVHPQARATMKFMISHLMGTISHPVLDLRVSSFEQQCKTLIFTLLITGYMIKKAQDRMDITKALEGPPRSLTRARTHNVQGDAITWATGPRSIPAAEYIASLEDRLKEYEDRENARYEKGQLDPLVDYMESMGEERLGELVNGASEDVLLAMHVCADEFLGGGELDESLMVRQLPHEEMCRLMEWLLTFGYALRCKEITHEIEKSFLMELEDTSSQ